MKLEDQVTSLELSKKLKSLNVKQESLYYWWRKQLENYAWMRSMGYHTDSKACSAFTVAELGEMLPASVFSEGQHHWLKVKKMHTGVWGIWYQAIDKKSSLGGEEGYFEADTEADARALLLCHLIENNLYKPEAKR